jgi:hypothetical protein
MRGEASVTVAGRPLLLRPSFAALVAAEAELGPLFALVERAAAGQLSLSEMIALFWYCLSDQSVDRASFADGVVDAGLANATPALRTLLGQILAGR